MTDPSNTTHSPSGALISKREILRFYTPLVLTSQLMTLSGPIINVAIGRATDPTLEFAGYWIGFSILLFLESACLVVQQLALAVVGGQGSLRRLGWTALAIGLSASLAALAVALTPIGDWVFQHLIPTTDRVADLARTVLVYLSPGPLIVALRGVANGIAIYDRRTTWVAGGTLLRVIVLSTVVGTIVWMRTGSGAIASATALVAGVGLETLFMIVVTAPTWRSRFAIRPTRSLTSEYGEILRIITPLAVSAIVWTSTRPVIQSILGRLPDPELAQASFGILLPIVLVTCSPLWALHNVTAVLPRHRHDLDRVMRFAVRLTLLFIAGIALLTMTPLKFLMLQLGFNLSPAMQEVVAPALPWIVLEPVFLSARALAQGLLIKAKRTEAFLWFAPIKIVLTAAIGLAVVTADPGINGAVLAVVLVVGGDGFDAIVYSLSARRLLKKGLVFRAPPPREPALDEAPPPAAVGRD